eukprot:10446784-Alexandrium_andersonii.AAC.1
MGPVVHATAEPIPCVCGARISWWGYGLCATPVAWPGCPHVPAVCVFCREGNRTGAARVSPPVAYQSPSRPVPPPVSNDSRNLGVCCVLQVDAKHA